MADLEFDLLGELFDFVLASFWPSLPPFAAVDAQLDVNGGHFLELHFLFQKRFFIFGALGPSSSAMLLAVVGGLRVLLDVLFLDAAAMVVVLLVATLIVVIIEFILGAQILSLIHI